MERAMGSILALAFVNADTVGANTTDPWLNARN
jgi:hypothetical protein